ncbi:MAG: Asp-tRNA(Asn)/Glu-tRNA(Gln) amidotransferase subunit GatC [Clostridia bacterium]|nr:MAG: Asp-tRNA(Asn)/Glu-tRNA(Gln) amidotransferase subunit GatC [Clostridia bacterium]
MSISLEEVEHVALLARLELGPAEKEAYTQQLNAILGYMEKLNELDTENVEPMAHVLPLANVFREDEVKPGLAPEAALDQAPDKHDNQFRVPKIV